MTKLVLPGMLKRRRGAIVNIGSAAATVAPSGALYSVYAGTKVQSWMFCPATLPVLCCVWRRAIVHIGSAAATVAPSGALYSVYAGTKV